VVSYTVHYTFNQSFPFPAREVYEWSTDFREDDWPRTGGQGTRKVEKLDDTTIILTDTRDEGGKPVTKVRLVRLFPAMNMWTNTRISKLGKHSQFIYQIVPDGPSASHLVFSGAQIESARTRPSTSKVAASAKKYTELDSLIWVNLAAAMEKDLGPRRSRGTSGNRAR
jgi:hypothetical protein